MLENSKTLEDVLHEVSDELSRLNQGATPSIPRYSSDEGLRIVEQNRSPQATKKPQEAIEAA